MTSTSIKKQTTSSHSLRCPDVTWARAVARARKEGIQVNTMIREILDGYGRGLIDLPTVTKQYAQPRAEAAE